MSGEDAVAWFLVILIVGTLVWTIRASRITSSAGRRWSMVFASAALSCWGAFYVWVHFDPPFGLRRDVSRGAVVVTVITFAFQAWAVIKSEPSNGVDRE